jgi:hypothetical protein
VIGEDAHEGALPAANRAAAELHPPLAALLLLLLLLLLRPCWAFAAGPGWHKVFQIWQAWLPLLLLLLLLLRWRHSFLRIWLRRWEGPHHAGAGVEAQVGAHSAAARHTRPQQQRRAVQGPGGGDHNGGLPGEVGVDGGQHAGGQ